MYIVLFYHVMKSLDGKRFSNDIIDNYKIV